MPEGYVGHSTEEERTVALSSTLAIAWISIATFGNRLTTAKLRFKAIEHQVIAKTDKGYEMVPLNFVWLHRNLLNWVIRLGLRKQLQVTHNYMLAHSAGNHELVEVKEYGVNAKPLLTLSLPELAELAERA